jgi:hypothetical protein
MAFGLWAYMAHRRSLSSNRIKRRVRQVELFLAFFDVLCLSRAEEKLAKTALKGTRELLVTLQ